MIRVSGLTKRYSTATGRTHPAVDGVSFEVRKGEVVGFLGPNGAGKSTTLRILAGFLGPSSGTVTIDGHDASTDSFEARARIGYMPEAVPLHPEMRVIEYLRFRAEVKRVPRAVRAAHVERAMTDASVVDVAHQRIGHLSKGYRQRVGLADAIVARPPIVILDEPTAGLDPNQIREVRQLVRDLGREHAVVLSSHILSEVEACATRVLLMHHGKLVAEGPTDRIRAMRGGSTADLVVRGDGSLARRILEGVDGVEGVDRVLPVAADGPERSADVQRLRVTFASDATEESRAEGLERCVAALVAGSVAVREARPTGGSLEDVFASLTLDPPRASPRSSPAEGDA